MPKAIYDWLVRQAQQSADHLRSPLRVEEVCLGLTWTYCTNALGLGLAMSPGQASRTLPWPGRLRGQPVMDLTTMITSWNPFEATLGLAAINSLINHFDNPLMGQAQLLDTAGPGNLAVFDHFHERLLGKKVVVIGHYPGMESVWEGLDITILERQPGAGDLPDPAAEYCLPGADWVFLSASTLANKTFPRLAELSRHAVTVLMGPSTPWLTGWADYGIDFIAGVRVFNPDLTRQIVMEGGGTRLFEQAAHYAVVDIGLQNTETLKQSIATTYAQRQHLMNDLADWVTRHRASQYPQRDKLNQVEAQLSELDTRYNRQWSARNP